LLNSLVRFNPDGIGFINGSKPVKVLPQNLKEAWEFYQQQVHGKAGALHFRLRTDGDISLSRVHPYEVLPNRLWMMHNGVLDGHRSLDEESDTEKYITTVLRPLLKRSIEILQIPEFQELISRDIGNSNRFVFVDRQGRITIINKHTGYELGADWYANSYSFDAAKFFPATFKNYSKLPVGQKALMFSDPEELAFALGHEIDSSVHRKLEYIKGKSLQDFYRYAIEIALARKQDVPGIVKRINYEP